ncbi:MAG: phage virion morphogenesis protein [Sphingomonadales bacterium CG12_big_fil_rev_8_21_14_0_65_65_10]|nr:MAG: phage virion morphogenesis protein [Sphingomonadales bacterium CG12_big_fil_rev_8_21_14_0_65_65_10]
MAVQLHITTEGGLEVQRAIGELVDRFGDLTPLMEGFGLTLESATIDRFDQESAPDGSKWTPSIRAREEGGKTLTDSAQLRSSITSIARSQSVEVGTNKIYAGTHQFGATIRPKSADKLAFQLPGGLGFRKVDQVTIPPRPFLGLSVADEEELLAQAEDYARDAAGGVS